MQSILTLDPKRFEAVGQKQFVGSRRVKVFSHYVDFNYPGGRNSDAFPPNSRGFLYYRKAPSNEPELSSAVRLRVVPPGTVNFAGGTDLKYPDGSPWCLPIYRITSCKGYAPIVDMLLADGFVTRNQVEQLKKLSIPRLHWSSTVLHDASEPFLWNLLSTPYSLHLITPTMAVKLPFIFSQPPHLSSYIHSFEGLVRVRLEKSPLPEHANTCRVAVRVLEIVEPIKVTYPDYQLQVAMPVAGELLKKIHVKMMEYKPWTRNLGKVLKGLDLDALFGASHRPWGIV